MSMLIGTFKTHLTFGEYLLSEGISPLSTAYGDNPPLFNNRNITQLQRNLRGSFFTNDSLLYFVQHDTSTGEIGFAKVSEIPNTTEDLLNMSFDVKPVGSSDGLKVLNKSFYVFLEILKITKSNYIFFNPASVELNRIYKQLAKNKFFNRELNKHGFGDLTFANGVYTTSRLEAS